MFKNIGIFLTSIILTLIIAEVALSRMGIGKYNLENRVLFYTSPSWVVDRNGAVRYAPNTNIRQVAIYGNHIDYDITKKTNNYGFFDSAQYEESHRRTKAIVFVGDSFTAGSGDNDNWIEQVRDMIGKPNLSIYNLGVGGTGIHHFHSLLNSVNEDVSFDEIHIMAISNDFFRKPWYPAPDESGVRFCSEEEKVTECINKRRFPIAHRIEMEETTEELLRRATRIYESKRTTIEAKVSYLHKMSLYNLFCDVYGVLFPEALTEDQCPHLKIYGKRRYQKNNDAYKQSIKELHEISESFPNVRIRVFHIPEKGEVYSGEYFLNLQEDLVKVGLEYIPLLHKCKWRTNMYHKHDPHPNHHGYTNLARCVATHLQ